MTATERMKKIVTEKYGVTDKSDCTPENLFFRQMAIAEVLEELEEKIIDLERRVAIMDNI